MIDVLIIGAGPAGAIAGLVLARAGARVRLVDRATFPRDKLCGDTLNPGTIARLKALGIDEAVSDRGLRVDGMVVTGEHGVAIEGRYPAGLSGRALLRRDLDWLLLEHALRAGCEFEAGVAVREPLVADRQGSPSVGGALVGHNGSSRDILARVTIAADGRRSAMAFGLGIARHPARPRRWAIGGYFEGVHPRLTAEDQPSLSRSASYGLASAGDAETSTQGAQSAARPSSTLGEMHIRRGRYIGVAPVPGGATNVCLVKPSGPADADLRNPAALLTRELARDPMLRDRFAAARLIDQPVVLGPLAVDVSPAHMFGLLLAGDAAGFVDPMTGDGLRFAIRGGELAAHAALEALEHGWSGVHARLAERRRREFGGKWRFNRALRALVASPGMVGAAAIGARLAPSVMRAVIARAGDCDVVERQA
jgi:flavin-dependent dehydrogenase